MTPKQRRAEIHSLNKYKNSSKYSPVDSVDKSKELFGKDSGIFSERFILSGGTPLILFGKETEKGRFVIMTLKDFFKLTNSLIKNGNKIKNK